MEIIYNKVFDTRSLGSTYEKKKDDDNVKDKAGISITLSSLRSRASTSQNKETGVEEDSNKAEDVNLLSTLLECQLEEVQPTTEWTESWKMKAKVRPDNVSADVWPYSYPMVPRKVYRLPEGTIKATPKEMLMHMRLVPRFSPVKFKGYKTTVTEESSNDIFDTLLEKLKKEKYLEEPLLWLVRHNIISCLCPCGKNTGHIIYYSGDLAHWFCDLCKQNRDVKLPPFFELLKKFELADVLAVILHWSCQSNLNCINTDTQLSPSEIWQIWARLRKVCTANLFATYTRFPTDSHIVEGAVFQFGIYLIVAVMERNTRFTQMKTFLYQGNWNLEKITGIMHAMLDVFDYSYQFVSDFIFFRPVVESKAKYRTYFYLPDLHIKDSKHPGKHNLNVIKYVVRFVATNFQKFKSSDIPHHIFQSCFNELQWRERNGNSETKAFWSMLYLISSERSPKLLLQPAVSGVHSKKPLSHIQSDVSELQSSDSNSESTEVDVIIEDSGKLKESETKNVKRSDDVILDDTSLDDSFSFIKELDRWSPLDIAKTILQLPLGYMELNISKLINLKTWPLILTLKGFDEQHEKQARVEAQKFYLQMRELDFFVKTDEWMATNNLVHIHKPCTVCDGTKFELIICEEAKTFDKYYYLCKNSKCKMRQPFTRLRFFSIFGFPMRSVVLVMFYWSIQSSLDTVVNSVTELKIHQIRYVYWAIQRFLSKKLESIARGMSDNGQAVELGIIRFGDHYIIGCTDTQVQSMRLKVIEKPVVLNVSMIERIVKPWLTSDTVVLTKKQCFCFQAGKLIPMVEPPPHITVGVNKIERLLFMLVKNLFAEYTSATMRTNTIQLYLDEIQWRELYGLAPEDAFWALLSQIIKDEGGDVIDQTISDESEFVLFPDESEDVDQSGDAPVISQVFSSSGDAGSLVSVDGSLDVDVDNNPSIITMQILPQTAQNVNPIASKSQKTAGAQADSFSESASEVENKESLSEGLPSQNLLPGIRMLKEKDLLQGMDLNQIDVECVDMVNDLQDMEDDAEDEEEDEYDGALDDDDDSDDSEDIDDVDVDIDVEEDDDSVEEIKEIKLGKTIKLEKEEVVVIDINDDVTVIEEKRAPAFADDEVFWKDKSLSLYWRTKTLRPFICKSADCGDKITKRNLEEPIDGSKRKICSLDEYFFARRKTNHVPSTAEAYAFCCTICKLYMYDNITVMDHTMNHATDPDDPFYNHQISRKNCSYCFTQFVTKEVLDVHVTKVHESESSLTCLICSILFDSSAHLIHHMQLIHCSSEMPYCCNVCHFRSSLHYEVLKHFREVHKIDPHLMCPFCLKICSPRQKGDRILFTQAYCQHLMKHHTGKLTIKCPACTLTFFSRSEIENHLLKDHVSFASKEGILLFKPRSNPVVLVSIDLRTAPNRSMAALPPLIGTPSVLQPPQSLTSVFLAAQAPLSLPTVQTPSSDPRVQAPLSVVPTVQAPLSVPTVQAPLSVVNTVQAPLSVVNTVQAPLSVVPTIQGSFLPTMQAPLPVVHTVLPVTTSLPTSPLVIPNLTMQPNMSTSPLNSAESALKQLLSFGNRLLTPPVTDTGRTHSKISEPLNIPVHPMQVSQNADILLISSSQSSTILPMPTTTSMSTQTMESVECIEDSDVSVPETEIAPQDITESPSKQKEGSINRYYCDCKYFTTCPKSFVLHMINEHDILNASKKDKISGTYPEAKKDSHILESSCTCSCGFSSSNGDLLANHLLSCKGHVQVSNAMFSEMKETSSSKSIDTATKTLTAYTSSSSLTICTTTCSKTSENKNQNSSSKLPLTQVPSHQIIPISQPQFIDQTRMQYPEGHMQQQFHPNYIMPNAAPMMMPNTPSMMMPPQAQYPSNRIVIQEVMQPSCDNFVIPQGYSTLKTEILPTNSRFTYVKDPVTLSQNYNPYIMQSGGSYVTAEGMPVNRSIEIIQHVNPYPQQVNPYPQQVSLPQPVTPITIGNMYPNSGNTASFIMSQQQSPSISINESNTYILNQPRPSLYNDVTQMAPIFTTTNVKIEPQNN